MRLVIVWQKGEYAPVAAALRLYFITVQIPSTFPLKFRQMMSWF